MIKKKFVSSSEESEEEIEELSSSQLIALKQGKVGRVSVSAECYGQFNKKEDFIPKVVNKTADQVIRLRQRLGQAFMFQCLEEKDLKIVVDAMDEKKYKGQEIVISQGEDGDHLYVVDQGELDCTKVFKKGEPAKYLKTYKPGESFGELSLLYNAPRAATIVANTDAVLFSLDRATFNNIVKDAASKKRVYYEHFLTKVELFSEMDPYERLQIADALKESKFKKGDYIIKQIIRVYEQGDKGTSFYLLQHGKCIATKNGSQEQLIEYISGDYFGELSLLFNDPRAANIIAQEDVTIVYLDGGSFRRIIGPLENILKRNTAKYAKYARN